MTLTRPIELRQRRLKPKKKASGRKSHISLIYDHGSIVLDVEVLKMFSLKIMVEAKLEVPKRIQES